MAKKKKSNKKNPARGRIWSVVIICLLAIAAFAVAFPPQDTIKKSLDLSGGLSCVLEAESSTTGEPVSKEDMDTARAVIEQRLSGLGASEVTVQLQGDKQILVQIPGETDSQKALELIGHTGSLIFVAEDHMSEDILNKVNSGAIYEAVEEEEDAGEAPTGAAVLEDTTKRTKIKIDDSAYDEVVMTGDQIESVNIGKESDTSPNYAVNLRVNGDATKSFADATARLASTNKRIFIIRDGRYESAPAVQSVIYNGEISITGNYTLDEAKSFATILQSGSLPVNFDVVQAMSVGAQLGTTESLMGVLSVLIGLIAIFIYMICFYRGLGLISCACMTIFAALYLGVLALLSKNNLFAMSLPGMAAIVLTIGISADSSILVIEKLKELLKTGKALKPASIEATKSAAICAADANIVSMISAVCLAIFGISGIRGFGFTLLIGLLLTVFTLLVFTVPAIRLIAPHVMRNHPGFWDVSYSLELGDVRTGSEHYMLPEEVAAEKKEDRAKKVEAQERKKAAEAAKKQYEIDNADKIAAAKERERKKEEAQKAAKRKAKEDKKMRLEELKAEDALRDEARKAAKAAAKEQAKLDKKAAREKEENIDTVSDLEDKNTNTVRNEDGSVKATVNDAPTYKREDAEPTDEESDAASDAIKDLLKNTVNPDSETE